MTAIDITALEASVEALIQQQLAVYEAQLREALARTLAKARPAAPRRKETKPKAAPAPKKPAAEMARAAERYMNRKLVLEQRDVAVALAAVFMTSFSLMSQSAAFSLFLPLLALALRERDPELAPESNTAPVAEVGDHRRRRVTARQRAAVLVAFGHERAGA